jgi:TfoX/Sxy family transcriptional regulator of competence genes
MAYNDKLADRVREIIALTHKNVEEKKMFSGLCFMVNEKMCVGIHQDRIMVRLDPELFDEVTRKPGCEPMNFTGKIMRGFVFVDESVLKSREQLDFWVQLGLSFNKQAKLSKKKVVKKTARKK